VKEGLEAGFIFAVIVLLLTTFPPLALVLAGLFALIAILGGFRSE